jgi:hypothetical protein
MVVLVVLACKQQRRLGTSFWSTRRLQSSNLVISFFAEEPRGKGHKHLPPVCALPDVSGIFQIYLQVISVSTAESKEQDILLSPILVLCLFDSVPLVHRGYTRYQALQRQFPSGPSSVEDSESGLWLQAVTLQNWSSLMWCISCVFSYRSRGRSGASPGKLFCRSSSMVGLQG